jgi:hypothetical protein
MAMAAALALLPAGIIGSELVVSTIVSRCFVNRASDVAERASSALWRMAGLGLGQCPAPEPVHARTFLSAPATALVLDVEKLDLPDGYETVTNKLLRPQQTPCTVITLPLHCRSLSSSSSSSSSASDSNSVMADMEELIELRHADAFARVKFVQAVLQDALVSLRPNDKHQYNNNNNNTTSTTGCSCGSLLCASATLQEALEQIEADLMQIVLHLTRIADRQARHRVRRFAAWRSSSHQVNVDAITLLLPRLEAKVDRLFHATPWITLVQQQQQGQIKNKM